jgi:hypothetical protein
LQRGPEPLDDAEMAALYAEPLPAPSGPLGLPPRPQPCRARHARDARTACRRRATTHASQLGWGTTLKAHWEPDVPINGFEVENDHPRYRDARAALAGAGTTPFVMTEMVEIRDAIRYFDRRLPAPLGAACARGQPGIRLYLYETWHPLDDPEGWLNRLDRDLSNATGRARSCAARWRADPLDGPSM